MDLQLIAIIVYFIFDIVRWVDIVAYKFRFLQYLDHAMQSLLRKCQHLVHIMVLLVCEYRFKLVAAFDASRHIIAGICYTFDLRYGTQHDTDFFLPFRTQAAFSHASQIIGNLDLHPVADTFVFLDTAICFQESILVLLIEQSFHHIQHTARTLGKQRDLLTCLQDRKFGSRQHPPRNIT